MCRCAVQECRAFELLRGQADRVNYLGTKHAKVVAMTCTHAALKRREFLKLGFRYDTLVMEESAQILEIETFIPMLLQQPQDGRNRLKRVRRRCTHRIAARPVVTRCDAAAAPHHARHSLCPPVSLSVLRRGRVDAAVARYVLAMSCVAASLLCRTAGSSLVQCGAPWAHCYVRARRVPAMSCLCGPRRSCV